jgi:DNA-binding NtrC family response regulator
MLATMSGLQVMVVSPDPARRRRMEEAMRAAGHQAVTHAEPSRAASELQSPGLDAVVVDLATPGLDREVLSRAFNPGLPDLPPEPLEAVERRHIHATLLYTGGNKRRAAQLLGIARSTLIQKVRRYGIEVTGRMRG